MRISKWVDFGQEVDVEIDADDIRCALAEAFARAEDDPLNGELPNRQTVLSAINRIATFLKGLSDDQIQDMTLVQRSIIWTFLLAQSERYAPPKDAA